MPPDKKRKSDKPRAKRNYPRCGANNKNGGGTCQRKAGAGTDHPGVGRCDLHMGNTESGKIAAAKELVSKEAVLHGLATTPDPIHPHDVVEQLVWLSWHHVKFCQSKVADLGGKDLIVRPYQEQMSHGPGGSAVEDLKGQEQLHVWIRTLQTAMDRAFKMSEAAIKLGVEERKVRLVETLVMELGAALRAVFAGLQLTADQKALAPSLMRQHLLPLELEVMG